MSKEIVIDHEEIRDPQKVTQVNIRKFEENGLNIHVNEVDSLEDDHKKGKRILKVRNTKYFTVPELPWKKEK